MDSGNENPKVGSTIEHGTASPRDAGYSFAVPAVANFFPRCWDPVHNASGKTSTIYPYKGDFYFDGTGTLPTGEPNLTSEFPQHLHVRAAANPHQYNNLTRNINPANPTRSSRFPSCGCPHRT